MKRLLTAILFSALASGAMAQTTTAPAGSNNSNSNNAVSTSGANNTARPAAGSNSFTEAQAKSRIEAKGYSKVSSLKKDTEGVWRGTAMKGGASQDVAVDYQGNVFGK